MRNSFLVAIFCLLCAFAMPVQAQVAGDSCAGTAAGAVAVGASQTLVCDGTNWKLMIETDTAGRSNLQINDDTANVCDASKLGRLAYDDGVDTWQYCDGANWVDLVGASGGGGVVPFFFDFTDLTDQTTNTIVTSDIVLISGIASALQVTITGGGTPQFQICDDFNCATVDHAWGNTAQNIDNGQYLQLRLTVPQAELTISTAIVSVGDAIADWKVTSPEGRTVFITNAVYNGAAVGGVDGADAKCQALADAVPLSGTYKAWISDSTTSPSVRFVQDGRPYVMTNGTFVADNWTDLVDGNLDAAINITQTGASNSNRDVWTATNTNGTYSFSSCSDWSSTSGNGTYGESEDTNNQWTNRSSEACGNSNYLYCFEQGASSSSASAPVPDYEQDWILVGTFDTAASGTCANCDTGLDVPDDAVEAVYIVWARTWDSTDYVLSGYDYGFYTHYEAAGANAGMACDGDTSAPNTSFYCVVLSPALISGVGTVRYEVLEDSQNKCEVELKPGDVSMYYDKTDSSSSDCAFGLWYR